MIYKNNFIVNPTKKIKVTFDKFFQQMVGKDENLLLENACVEKFNFTTNDGSLKKGMGLRDLTVLDKQGNDRVIKTTESSVDGIWTARWLNSANQKVLDYIFYETDDGVMHYVELSAPKNTYEFDHVFTDIPTVTKVRKNLTLEAFAFTSSDGLLLVDELGENFYPSVPKVMDACYQYNMMFAITKETRNALVYSSNLDVSSWTSANTYRIDFTDERGRLIKLMTYNDNLYVFREFGITKITPYGVSLDFSIEHLYQSSSYIYPQTISICGNEVVFMTKDGLYSFNGSSVKKKKFDVLDKILKDETASPCAIGFRGKYFLACKMDFSDGVIGCENEESYVNNAVLIFDFENSSFDVIRGVDVKKFAELSSVNFSRLCAIFNGENAHRIGEFVDNGKVFSQNIECQWRSAFTDLGFTGNLKHIDEIKLIAVKDCQIVFKTDLEEKVYDIVGLGNVQRVKVDVKGRLISVSFKSSSLSQKISKPEISLTVYT